jgi:hypothetical protein
VNEYAAAAVEDIAVAVVIVAFLAFVGFLFWLGTK